jgi:hypothetical protein
VNAPRDAGDAYRRRLLAYPRRWREANGEELLAVLIAGAEGSQRSHPSAAETWDLLRHGLSARARELLWPFSPVLRDRITTLSLAGGASLAMVCLLFGELPAIAGPCQQVSYQSMTTFPPLLTVAPLLYLGFLATLALTVAGRVRPALNTGLLLLTLSVGVTLTSFAARSRPVAAPPIYLSLFFVAVSLLTCMGRVDLSRTGRWWLALGSLGLGGVFALALTLQPQDFGAFVVEDPRWTFYRGWRTGIHLIAEQTWILLVAGLLMAALVSARRPGWFAASTVAALPWLYLALLFAGGSNSAHPLAPALSLCAFAVVAGVLALAYRAGRLRTSGVDPQRPAPGSCGTGSHKPDHSYLSQRQVHG